MVLGFKISGFVAARRNKYFTERQSSAPTHRINNENCRLLAPGSESPTPVQTATYAAKHMGHFGISARIAPGTSQPAVSRHHRAIINRCGCDRPPLDCASERELLTAISQIAVSVVSMVLSCWMVVKSSSLQRIDESRSPKWTGHRNTFHKRRQRRQWK
jgi:hypothetical protein